MTQQYLMSILSYNKKTGQFISTVNRGKKCKVGDIIGSINSKGYVVASINSKTYKMHQLAFLYVYGYIPKMIDHKNREKTDNRIKNLRECTAKENQKNMPKSKANKSGETGIIWDEKRKKWKAIIGIDRKQYYLGMFENINQAVRERKKALKRFEFYKGHGE